MKPRKAKASEPSLRDRLSANFLAAFQADFEANGVAAIEQLRQKSPEKYADIAARLIATTEPGPDIDFTKCKSIADIGRSLLRQAGMADDDITDAMIEVAVEATIGSSTRSRASRRHIGLNSSGNALAIT